MKFGFFARRAAEAPPAAPRPLPHPIADWGPPPLLPEPSQGDVLLEELLMLAPRRRCLLAWGDGGRVARMSVALHAAGAASTLVAHPGAVPGEAMGELLEAGRRLGLPGPARELARRAPVGGQMAVPGAVDCDAGRPWRCGGDLASAALGALAGPVDVVADGSQLIHWPDPLARLRALAATGARHVVLETPLLQADADLTAAGFAPGQVWYAVGMSPGQSMAMADYWTRRDVTLRQYSLLPRGFTSEEAAAAGFGAVAWWSFTDLAGLDRLLSLAGLRLLRQRSVWEGRAVVVVAEPVGA
jgi:hypothetical protein